MSTSCKQTVNCRQLPLRADDAIMFDGQTCEVVRVNECPAVMAIRPPARLFEILAGEMVRFQPQPRLARISHNSAGEILSRWQEEF